MPNSSLVTGTAAQRWSASSFGLRGVVGPGGPVLGSGSRFWWWGGCRGPVLRGGRQNDEFRMMNAECRMQKGLTPRRGGAEKGNDHEGRGSAKRQRGQGDKGDGEKETTGT